MDYQGRRIEEVHAHSSQLVQQLGPDVQTRRRVHKAVQEFKRKMLQVIKEFEKETCAIPSAAEGSELQDTGRHITETTEAPSQHEIPPESGTVPRLEAFLESEAPPGPTAVPGLEAFSGAGPEGSSNEWASFEFFGDIELGPELLGSPVAADFGLGPELLASLPVAGDGTLLPPDEHDEDA